jgi:hypothetical protein
LDELIRNPEFLSILKYDKKLSNLFNIKLKFTNFQDSFYDALTNCTETLRNTYLKVIKDQIINSTASDDFKTQASLLDNFITPPKC